MVNKGRPDGLDCSHPSDEGEVDGVLAADGVAGAWASSLVIQTKRIDCLAGEPGSVPSCLIDATRLSWVRFLAGIGPRARDISFIA